LSQMKDKVNPSEDLCQKILADLSVTEKAENRYNLQNEEKGRVSGYELILNQIHNLMTKWRIIVPAAMVVLLVVGIGIFRFGQKRQTVNQENEQIMEQSEQEFTEYVEIPKEVSVPESIGTIDDVIGALNAFAENEQVIIVEEGNDASMVTIDSQAVSDFGQSYDENQF